MLSLELNLPQIQRAYFVSVWHSCLYCVLQKFRNSLKPLDVTEDSINEDEKVPMTNGHSFNDGSHLYKNSADALNGNGLHENGGVQSLTYTKV